MLTDEYGDILMLTSPEQTNQWAAGESGYFAVNKCPKYLPAGEYTLEMTRAGLHIKPASTVSDEFIAVEGEEDAVSQIIKTLDGFWGEETANIYKQLGVRHKRGFLLYGPQGTGKTGVIRRIVRAAIEASKAVTFYIDTDSIDHVAIAASMLRSVEPKRPLICVYEDVDNMIDQGDEAHLLAFLDGEKSVDHVVNIATTNYLEKLPDRIKKRPRRFDDLVEVKAPTDAVRLKYFTHKLGRLGITDKKVIKTMVDSSKGFSFAAMTDLLVSVYGLKRPLEESKKSLKKVMTDLGKDADD